MRQTSQILKQATQHWKYIAPVLTYPKNDKEYDLLVEFLDILLDTVEDNEAHSFMGLIEIVSHLVSSYDDKNFQISVKGLDALKYLMELRQLNQSDLYKIASQGVISEILNGKRKMNLRQIIKLAKYFKVDPGTFIDD